jgi:hypothetical protein
MLCLSCGAEMMLVPGGQGRHDVCVGLRASYVAVLGPLDRRAADDIYSRGDTDPNGAGGAAPNSAVEPTKPAPLSQTVSVEPAYAT